MSAAAVGQAPFSAALATEPRGSSSFRAALGDDWTVGGKAHGGVLLALLSKAALAALDRPADPLAVSAEYLYAPDPGEVEIRTELIKTGRTVSVIDAALHQAGRVVVRASVTAGSLPDAEPQWSDLPEIPATPPGDALDASVGPFVEVLRLARVCELRLDNATASFTRGERSMPLLRGWVRPVGEQPGPLFALAAADILPPSVFNVGGLGWSPTVQLTALVRARPAPGWLRLESTCRVLAGGWFDEDTLVIDEAGRLVCQLRQLALTPRSAAGR